MQKLKYENEVVGARGGERTAAPISGRFRRGMRVTVGGLPGDILPRFGLSARLHI